MMGWGDIPRILKGLFTTENVSDDEIYVAVLFIAILVIAFTALILCI